MANLDQEKLALLTEHIEKINSILHSAVEQIDHLRRDVAMLRSIASIIEPSEKFISTDAAAKMLSIDKSTLRRLVAVGRFPPPVKVTGRLFRFRMSDINRWGCENILVVSGDANDSDSDAKDA